VIDEEQAVVDASSAVVVDAVADLDLGGIDVGIGVIAVVASGAGSQGSAVASGGRDRSGARAVSVGVGVVVDEGQAVVDAAHAVVVDVVADLWVAGKGLVVVVVAVAIGLRHAGWRAVARVRSHVSRSFAVSVVVGVPVREHEPVVDELVAVVVDVVADLRVARKPVGIGVVAVLPLGNPISIAVDDRCVGVGFGVGIDDGVGVSRRVRVTPLGIWILPAAGDEQCKNHRKSHENLRFGGFHDASRSVSESAVTRRDRGNLYFAPIVTSGIS